VGHQPEPDALNELLDRIAAAALQALAEHPFPAVKLSEVTRLVGGGVDRSLDARRLRSHLERYPDSFTVLDPMRGPWRWLLPKSRVGVRTADPWVLGQSSASPGAVGDRCALIMRDSIRWLARHLDPDSPTQVAHWCSVLLSERDARRTLVSSRSRRP